MLPTAINTTAHPTPIRPPLFPGTDPQTLQTRMLGPSRACAWQTANPCFSFNWPTSRKWLITLTTCFMCVSAPSRREVCCHKLTAGTHSTLIVGINATAIASAAEEINHEFGVSDEHFPHSYWPVCSWNFGAALVPLVALPLMENFGVRTGYLVGLSILSVLTQQFVTAF